jgi:glycosyltransferase involved in cell wall biosynthesis
VSPQDTVVIPARDCHAGVERVLARLAARPDTQRWDVLVIDDGSDSPIRPASLPSLRTTVLRHPHGRGYGAAQKTGYAAALARGAARVVMLHGDDQYDVDDTLALLDALDDDHPAVLGSRFRADPGVIPAWRRWGNRGLTVLANARFGTAHTELHSGARAYDAGLLARLPLDSFSDDYRFDQDLLAALLGAGVRIAERPVRVRYDGEVQSISLGRSVRYGLGCLAAIARPYPLLTARTAPGTRSPT